MTRKPRPPNQTPKSGSESDQNRSEGNALPANSKARKLGDLLERQKAFKEIKRPYVEPHVRESYKQKATGRNS